MREAPEGDLDDAAKHDSSRNQPPVAELLDHAEDDRGQAGGRPCNLKGRSGDQARDQAADDAGDESGHDRGARRQRDAERQRNGDEEDDERRKHVLPRRGEEARSGPHAERWVKRLAWA